MQINDKWAENGLLIQKQLMLKQKDTLFRGWMLVWLT